MRTVFQPLRSWLISGSRSATQLAVATMILFFATGAMAETTNTLSDLEIQGRALARQIVSAKPEKSLILTGLMKIRTGTGTNYEYPFWQSINVWTNLDWDWESQYAFGTKLPPMFLDSPPPTNSNQITLISISHPYKYTDTVRYCSMDLTIRTNSRARSNQHYWQNGEAFSWSGIYMQSDFCFADLGLEFFHWPQQKILKKEFHRQCACMVLESTNPNPATNGYSRVVSWIDEDSLGIVEAYAYDAQGKKLKNFYPKKFEKVNGQYQVQSLIMENVQTGSRTTLEFDLKK